MAKRKFENIPRKIRKSGRKIRRIVKQAEEQWQEASELMPNLPNEITFDILSRLPIKTLSACRWVNKAWYKTIKQPEFIKAHHDKLIQNNSDCLIFAQNFCYFIDHESLSSIQTTINSPLFILQVQPRQGTKSFEFFSCNGIVLVCSETQPYSINNPITGEQVLVHQSENYNGICDHIGFGFDPVSEVFKILRMFCGSGKTYAEVYNCGTGKWRVIDNNPWFSKITGDVIRLPEEWQATFQELDNGVVQWRLIDNNRSSKLICNKNNVPNNVFVNGSLHWLGLLDSKWTIISFKLNTEEFQLIPLPLGVDLSRKEWHIYLCVLGNYLCVVDEINEKHLEIWMMRDYGRESSWDKKYIIRNIVEDNGDVFEERYRPIGLMQNGEILLMYDYDRYLGYYDPVTKVLRCIDIDLPYQDPKNLSFLLPLLHVGSLISPCQIGK
ncbi:hypothetical protein AQUCO_01300586v1 [Aquilegia coerulea]|uniref:F-box domain-containing protein n=1 Tax=Aquilegia coerulea TaxID=218851 RepID=A0A2G5E2E1_AQUCA|nr:hypothetical protein AQUCO_01300586v1 [Aquilegia coerulea]